jgi:hypothetical protein
MGKGLLGAFDVDGRMALKEQLRRIEAYLLLWAVPALVVAVGFFLHLVTNRTFLPDFLAAELEKPLDMDAIVFALSLGIVAFLLALGFGATGCARVVAEDIGSVFYIAGAFCIVFVSVVSMVHAHSFIAGVRPVGIGFASLLCGMVLQTFGVALTGWREQWHLWQRLKQCGRRR